jgi:hypothetical protein
VPTGVPIGPAVHNASNKHKLLTLEHPPRRQLRRWKVSHHQRRRMRHRPDAGRGARMIEATARRARSNSRAKIDKSGSSGRSAKAKRALADATNGRTAAAVATGVTRLTARSASNITPNRSAIAPAGATSSRIPIRRSPSLLRSSSS